MTVPRRPTLADVARLAAVDKAVVSRVLSGDPALRVRDETRQRVLSAVEQLGYRRNAMAQGLRVRRASAVGLIIPTYDNPVYTAIIEGAASGAFAHSSFLLTASVGTMKISGESPADLVATGRVDGLLLAGHVSDELEDNRSLSSAPVLSLNRRIKGFDRWVVLDDEGAVAMAVDHLVRLGHRRIAHIAGPATADTASRRRAGFIEALKGFGAEVDESLVVEADYTIQGGVAAASLLVDICPPPTAIVAANAASAVGAVFSLRRRGLGVPEDMSVVAIHDFPLVRYLESPLTVVAMPLVELGRRGVELLMTRPMSEPIEEVVMGPMRLIERASTAAPRRVGR